MKKVGLVLAVLCQVCAVAEQGVDIGVSDDALLACQEKIQSAVASVQEKETPLYPKEAKLELLNFLSAEVSTVTNEYKELVMGLRSRLMHQMYSSLVGKYGITESDLSAYLADDLKNFSLMDYLKLSNDELMELGQSCTGMRFKLDKKFERLYVSDEVKAEIEQLTKDMAATEQTLLENNPEYARLKGLSEAWKRFLETSKNSREMVALTEQLAISVGDLQELAQQKYAMATEKAWYVLSKDQGYAALVKQRAVVYGKYYSQLEQHLKASDPDGLKQLINSSLKEQICYYILEHRGYLN